METSVLVCFTAVSPAGLRCVSEEHSRHSSISTFHFLRRGQRTSLRQGNFFEALLCRVGWVLGHRFVLLVSHPGTSSGVRALWGACNSHDKVGTSPVAFESTKSLRSNTVHKGRRSCNIGGSEAVRNCEMEGRCAFHCSRSRRGH